MKRKFALLTLFAACIYLSYLSVVSWLSGFLVAKYGGGKREEMRGRIRSIIIPVGRRKFHLHHWFIGSVAILLGITRSIPVLFSPEIFYGALGGLVFQGVYCYKDWYRIIK